MLINIHRFKKKVIILRYASVARMIVSIRINPERLNLCHKGTCLPVFIVLQIRDSVAQVLLDYCTGCILANYSTMQEKKCTSHKVCVAVYTQTVYQQL